LNASSESGTSDEVSAVTIPIKSPISESDSGSHADPIPPPRTSMGSERPTVSSEICVPIEAAEAALVL
jgi:hypothetical protein